MHLTSSGRHPSITPASSMVSMLWYKYCHCRGVSGFWCTFIRNVASSGILRWCIALSTVLTSLTERVNMSAKDFMRSHALNCSSSLRLSPIVIIHSSSCTLSGLWGSFILVNNLTSFFGVSTSISVDLSPLSCWCSSITILTGVLGFICDWFWLMMCAWL